ncbi:MAG: endodeoxyribonuclease RusA [Casimicrobium sp.]
MSLLILPWPPSILSPNARSHWAALSKAKRSYRHACWTLAKAHGAPDLPADGEIILAITFVPPSRRKVDDDNLIAAFKSGRDGIADAWGVNDVRFVSRVYVDRGNIGGIVKVEVLNEKT